MTKVIIIGGGWSGCAAALTARKSGADVALLERTDMLLGSGLVGGIFRNNGRFTAAEEMIALGGGELFEIMDSLTTHVNIEFPGHKHSSLYNASKIEPVVHRLLEKNNVDIHLQTRITELKKEKETILSVISDKGEKYVGDAFIDCTGTTAYPAHCIKYGNGCAMCIYRCSTFKPRVSISEKAGVKDIVAMRSDGTPGVFSGSCKIMKQTLSKNIVKELEETGVSITPIPEQIIDESKLSKKACVQYALPEYASNIILLDTGFAKMMTPYFSLEQLRKIPGFEDARYEDPYAGGIGNSIRYMAIAPRDNALRVIGIKNLFCAGEKAGLMVGHTEVIVTGSLAGYNSVKHCTGQELLILPNKLAVGDAVSQSNNQTEEGLKTRYTFAGGSYFERMKKLRLYSTDINEIRERVKDVGLENVFA